MKHVIIGNSAGAIGCIEAIRHENTEDEIVVIASEPHHTYGRPLISYYLEGRTDRQRMKYRADDFYEKNCVQTMLGETVTKILPEEKKVALQSGDLVSYDKLLVATGSSPVIFPAEGLELVKDITTFTTLDDAEYLLERVNADARVFIVGAGLIGLKCAEGLRALTEHITVCDLAPRVLSSILPEQPARIMREHLEAHGLKFCLGTGVQRFSVAERGYVALLQSGEPIAFDLLVYAAGVRPNTGLIKDAGGEVNRGILVDEYGRTNLPDIYAAGDCTEAVDVCTGARKIMALLPNAYFQGEAAGRHMAGLAAEHTPLIPENAIGFFGKHILSAGIYPEALTPQEENTEEYYKCFYFDEAEGKLRGYILIEGFARAGIYTALVRDGTKLRPAQWERLRREPGLLAFDIMTRAKILRKKVGAK
ncbi:MAG: FAD-dependent oxidoreductase [Oscillospiraceae bacterium]|jgi:NAD(P)H-nitrite reductase large subunit|nr:FAD-dependent oxidoreductase [Oscillospiraceae bacterium]